MIAILEADVLVEKLLAGKDPVLAVLREQLKQTRRHDRQMSGVGFFSHFSHFAVPADIARIPGNPSIWFGDVHGKIEGLQYGADFVLFVDDGIITMLEGCSFQEPWPSEIRQYELNYLRGAKRDLAALRRSPGWPS